MALADLVADCPRCGAMRMSFDAGASITVLVEFGWLQTLETFAVCRNCHRSTVFLLRQTEYDDRAQIVSDGVTSFKDSLNNHFSVVGHISKKDESTVAPPDHLPPELEAAFKEASTCLAVQCWSAAGVMFRVCVDIATRELLPAEGGNDGPNHKQRRDLGLRLPWLFDRDKLPSGLRDLSACVHQDGNDGAHQGTLSKVDAEDLLDFTAALLERLYTEPKRLELAQTRREERRKPKEA